MEVAVNSTIKDLVGKPKNLKIDYLIELKGNTRALAEEYIRKTPSQIETKYRNLI